MADCLADVGALTFRQVLREMEIYIRDHSDAEFSHGLCSECMPRMRQEVGLTE